MKGHKRERDDCGGDDPDCGTCPTCQAALEQAREYELATKAARGTAKLEDVDDEVGGPVDAADTQYPPHYIDEAQLEEEFYDELGEADVLVGAVALERGVGFDDMDGYIDDDGEWVDNTNMTPAGGDPYVPPERLATMGRPHVDRYDRGRGRGVLGRGRRW